MNSQNAVMPLASLEQARINRVEGDHSMRLLFAGLAAWCVATSSLAQTAAAGEQARAEARRQREEARAQREEQRAQREERDLQAEVAAQLSRIERLWSMDPADAAQHCGVPGFREPTNIWGYLSPGRPARVFQDGDLNSSDCARLRVALAQTVPALDLAVEDLGYYYSARARRQRTLLDVGSGVVVMSGIGYAASGRVGVSTQSFWGYSALLTVLLAEWNANEPTEALFDAGHAGLSLIAIRYRRIRELRDQFELALDRAEENRPNCEGDTWLPDTSGWTIDPDQDALALLAEYTRIRAACRSLAQGHRQLEMFRELSDTALLEAYRADVRRLDHMLSTRDAELRHTPDEILTTLPRIAGRAVDTLLTGGESSQALATVQIQTAVTGLSMAISPLDVPPSPTLSTENLAPAPALSERASRSSNRARLLTAVVTLGEQGAGLEDYRASLSYARTLAEELRALAGAQTLGVSWSLEARAPQVSLTPVSPATAR